MTTPDRPIGAGVAGGGLWPAHLPRPVAPGVLPPAAAQGAAAAPTIAPEESTQRWPWKGVQWNLTYVGFLAYVFAITTYRLPIGDVSIVLALIGLLMMKEPTRVPGLLKGLGVFLLWGLVGSAFSNYPDLVFTRLDQLVKLWLIALVAANALRTRAQVRFFLFFWLACFALYPVRGAFFNYYVYRETLFGRALWNYIFSNPNDLAAYCILQLSMAFALYGMELKGPVRLGARLGLVVLPMLILLTKSRGAFLGFAMFLLFVLWGQKKRGRALGITIAVAASLIFIAPTGVLDRVFALKNIQETGDVAAADEEGSAEQRYEIWKVARLIIRQNPVVGVGLGAYPAEHLIASRQPQFKPTARGRRDTHSTYFNLTAETGFVGLFIWVLSYVSAFVGIEATRRKLKKLRPTSANALYALEVGSIGFFIAAMFGSMAHVSFLVLHVITIWSIADLMKREVAAGAAARRAQAYQLANAGMALPAGR
jgi:O-antigen ligase